MKRIYKKRSFIIYRVNDGYIVHNTEKSFPEGHTHISNLNTAKRMINVSIRKELPNRLSDYLLESLLRMASDADFKSSIENMRKNRKKGKEKEDMKKYIGTKVILAKPMNRGEYNNYRGWQIPADENPADEGYLVKYSDDYESWSPKVMFDAAYRAFDGGMNFGHAIELLKMGFKVARKGWNGKKQYIELASNISYVNAGGEVVNCEHDAIGNKAIAFVGTSGVQMGWLASQADMLAADWVVVEQEV